MKILIIDDEPLIHISIEKLIHNYCETIEVFHAYNGQEMQLLLQKHDFLLAYVDIKLPGISGLEAIRCGKEISPNTIYYIMTGFDSFEFAKEAIKLKVEDYLMKPLDYDTIVHTIQYAQNSYDAYKKEQKSLFRHWLESIINHHECTLERYNNYYRSALLITTDLLDFPQEALLNKLMPFNDHSVSTVIDNHIILLCFSENPEILRSIHKSLASEQYTHGITVFATSIVKNSTELKSSIENLKKYACLRVILGAEKYYALKPLLNYDEKLVTFCNTAELWKNSYQCKLYNDYVRFSEQMCSELEQMELLHKYYSQIQSFINQSLGETSQTTAFSIDLLRKTCQKYAAAMLQSSGSERIVDTIIQYINEHYCDDLSIAMLSEQFALSANHITNLLKQELGIRYNDYITQLRLEHAKELLVTTTLSVKNITSACGYYSQSHFTKLFVEKEGCTPIEYRKRNTIS